MGFEGRVVTNCRHVADTTRPRPGGRIRPSSPTSLRGTFAPGTDYPKRLGKGNSCAFSSFLVPPSWLVVVQRPFCSSVWRHRQALRQVIRVLRRPRPSNAQERPIRKHIEVSAGTSVAVAVKLTGASDIVIRDRDGNILFAVDQSARTTTVGKQRRQRASSPPTVERALPDGCEGAFSPYAEPARAHVIGRCVSGVFPGTDALA
jgi:hypothetical protein